MRRAALLFAGITVIATAAFSGEPNVRRSARPIQGRYIVVLEADADAATVASTVRNLKGSRVRHSYGKGLKGLSVEMSDADAQVLARDVRVQFVEEDATVSASATTWALDRIDQRSLPLNGSYINDGTGAGVTVYVLDTGIVANHTDFGGRVAAGFSAFSDNIGSTDCNGHGTHVAGVVGGLSHGVATASTLVPVRVLDCDGSGSVSTLLAGLDWVMERQSLSPGPAVVNMSLGGAPSSALDLQIARVITAGITTVVAAGNGNQDACGSSPGRVSGAITVGASNEQDQRASFSNYGSCVDLFAPGTNILSASHASPTATAVTSGTSSAAPFVAGVAALCLERYPDASPNTVASTVLAQATTDVLSGVLGSPNRLVFSLIGARDDSSQGASQLLADPGFEFGSTFWTSDICTVVNPSGCPPGLDDLVGIGSGDFVLQSLSPRSGKTRAVIGGPAKTFHLNSEMVAIPSSARRVQLSFYLWVVTKNKKQSINDVLTVEIRNSAGALVETLGKFSNLDAAATYGQRTFDVTRYRGMSIRVSFTGIQDQGPPTYFLLDDVTLNAWR